MTDFNRLQHEILGVLKRIALKVRAHGSEADGYIAINKLMPETAILQFGMLVALLNDYDKHIVGSPGEPTFPNQRKIKREQINDNKYSFEDVAMAIETLEFNDEIKDIGQGAWIDIVDRQIQLTRKGVVSYNTQVYLKADMADSIVDSTLATNKAVRDTAKATIKLVWVTVAVVGATIATPIVAAILDGQRSRLEQQVEQQAKTIQQLQQQVQELKESKIRTDASK